MSNLNILSSSKGKPACLISLHIHSMWETICGASASCSVWNFCSKIPVYPKLGFVPVDPPHPPPPPNKLQFGQDMALWVLTTPVYQTAPPPPHPRTPRKSRKIEIWTGLGTLSFDYPRLPPPPHWNLDRTWHFDFWLPQSPPPLRDRMWRLISVSPWIPSCFIVGTKPIPKLILLNSCPKSHSSFLYYPQSYLPEYLYSYLRVKLPTFS